MGVAEENRQFLYRLSQDATWEWEGEEDDMETYARFTFVHKAVCLRERPFIKD